MIEGTYRTSVVLHNSMETHQSVCEWVGDTLNVYISTQYIWGVRSAVAEELGIPGDKVRVVCEYMGGGFGSKNDPGEYTFIAAELAKRTGRPVRCALTRREENTAAGNRNLTIQRLTVGARSDGTIVALGGEFVNGVGWSGWSATTDGPMQMLYACDNVRTVRHGAKINMPPMKAFRAPGFVEGTFGLECLIDELAVKLELDPLELRRKNYADSNEGKPYSSKNLMECYDLAVKHWERRDEVRARSTDTCEARRRHGVADLVRRRRPAVVRVDARRLGRPRHRRHRDAGHRHRHADGDGADRRRGARRPARPRRRRARRQRARTVCDAVRRLVHDAVRRPGRARGRGGREAPDHRDRRAALRPRGARARHQGRRRRLGGRNLSTPLHDLLEILENSQILGKGGRGPNPTGMSVLTFGVQVVEVAVDIETGEVRVERVAAAHDVGRIINPLGARSQVEGGIIQGIGHTLSEQRLHDPETGRILTTSLDAYRMPTIADIPEIVCEFVDKPDEHLTNLGSKGIGEPPIIPLAAAVANAIRDATGADVHELPITREEMLRALEAAKKKERRGAPAAV